MKGLFLAQWLISVAIAIRNTYKNRIKCKQAKTSAKAFQGQSNTYGILQAVLGEGCKKYSLRRDNI